MGIMLGRSMRWAGLRPLAGWIAVAICGAACTTASDGVPPISETNAPPSAAPSEQRSERDAVVDAYTRFWPRLHAASVQPESQWRPLLAEVATEPQLGRAMAFFPTLRAQSRKLYGEVTARISDVEISGDRATVVDCQDASHAGQADLTTGDPKTVGVERNPVRATLIRGTDKIWRVSEVSNPGGTC